MSGFNERPLGIYEKALPDTLDWENKLEAVRKAGFDFIEISIDESDKRLDRLNWSQSQRAKLKKLLVQSGVRMPSMCLSGHRRFPLGSKKKKLRDKSLEIMSNQKGLLKDCEKHESDIRDLKKKVYGNNRLFNVYSTKAITNISDIQQGVA